MRNVAKYINIRNKNDTEKKRNRRNTIISLELAEIDFFPWKLIMIEVRMQKGATRISIT